jgi:hypothetical protein
MMAAVEDTMKA